MNSWVYSTGTCFCWLRVQDEVEKLAAWWPVTTGVKALWWCRWAKRARETVLLEDDNMLRSRMNTQDKDVEGDVVCFVFCLFVVVVSVCDSRARSHLLIDQNNRRNEFPTYPDMPKDDDYKWKREDNSRGNHNFEAIPWGSVCCPAKCVAFISSSSRKSTVHFRFFCSIYTWAFHRTLKRFKFSKLEQHQKAPEPQTNTKLIEITQHTIRQLHTMSRHIYFAGKNHFEIKPSNNNPDKKSTVLSMLTPFPADIETDTCIPRKILQYTNL